MPERLACALMLSCVIFGRGALAQEYGLPDRGEPGDLMIQEYLRMQTERIHQSFAEDVASPEAWRARLPQYREEYLHMLGLWPLPEKTPLRATVTGTLQGDGFVVEKLHYQSLPGLYVTGNLYRPAHGKTGEKFPAVFYVCGHSLRGRDGNKTAYQAHGMWFARHGYVCLVVDTLQLGEIAAIHHGTYREELWWWHSRGYTSAGVECWNGVRGIDYLVGRDDVDAERIAVTGISGGGAATFWIACADNRVTACVPVSGMADLPSYVSHRVINGHCDCMFLYNTFEWPWTRIAALFAPRPMLFVNSDADAIFPMDANERVINRLERVYSLYGAGDQIDAVVSIGGHAYRQDIRQAAYRFINTHLKNDPRPVTDSEVDLVSGPRSSPEHPILPERLRVFPTDGDLPADELNTTIDEHFVPMAKVELPAEGAFDSWKAELLEDLRRVTFRPFPNRVPPARRSAAEQSDPETIQIETEPGIRLFLREKQRADQPVRRVRLLIQSIDDPIPEWLLSGAGGEVVHVVEPRGIGRTRWTRKNPPNYVERSHVLLGRTVDGGRVWDVIATARFLKERNGSGITVEVAGEGANGIIAAYAALLEPEIDAVIVRNPPASHMDKDAPQFLNILRVCDVPEMLGMLAPRPLTILATKGVTERVSEIYSAAGAAEKLTVRTP